MKDTYYYDLIKKYRYKLLTIFTVLIPVIYFLNLLFRHEYINNEIRLDSYYYFILIFILIPMYFYEKHYLHEKYNIIEKLVFLYLIINLITSFTAVNKTTAFLGYNLRYEGFLTICFYMFYFLNISRLNIQEKKSFIYILMFTIIVHFITIIFQETSLYSRTFFKYKSLYPTGLTSNSDFLASLVSSSSILFGLLYYFYHKKRYLISFILSYLSLIITNVTSPLLAYYLVLILFIIISLIKRTINKRIIVLLLITLLIYPIFNKYSLFDEFKENVSFIENEQYDKLGHNRLKIWKKTGLLIVERPVLGYGNDNLIYVYEKDANGKVADKAHNIYLNMVVSNGIFSVIVYLSMIVLIIKKIDFHDKYSLCLLLFILVYLIQGFFNINVIEVTPYFYMILGCLYKNDIIKKESI